MSDIVSPLLQWLNANPEWAGVATFAISAAESIAVIGTIVPGSITMTAIGTLAGAGVIPLWATIFWAMLGAVVGDGISYWLGHAFKGRLCNSWPFKNNPSILQKGEAFVHKYGVMSVFIGRFVGPARALVPLVAGMLGMKPLHFTIANITSAIGWAPIYMLPGILLGAASLELPPDIAMHVILVLMLMILFALLCIWTAYKILQLISKQTDQFLTHIWNGLKNSRFFHPATILLKHHNPKQHHGQLTLAFYFLLISFMLFCLLIYVKTVGPQSILVNDALYHFFRGIRTAKADDIMLNITLLGQKQIILPMVMVLFSWLFITKRIRVAFHALALGVLAAAGVYVLKHLMQTERPWGIFFSAESFSMPSGHTALATTVYMGIAFMIASHMQSKYRWVIYLPAVLITFLVGISRLYLGAHWFTDVLAAWLLSTAVLMLILLSYQRHREEVVGLLNISVVCASTLFICYAFYYSHNITQLRLNYAQTNRPTTQIELNEWWAKNEMIPESRVSLFGFPSQGINIQWAGDLDQIRETLLKEGWTSPPARDWISTLHRIADIKSTEYLPMVSPQYLDKHPALILAKRTDGKEKLMVVRLWASSCIMKKTQTPLWVGTVGTVPRSYGWIFQRQRNFEINSTSIFNDPQHTQKKWQTKIITVSISSKKHDKQVMKKVLLIKENK